VSHTQRKLREFYVKSMFLFALGVTLGFGPRALSMAAEKIVMPTRGICAHRGACVSHPENTLPAFAEAIRLGVHQIEFDVYLTKDKQCVVIHDGSVDRTTDGKGKVSELTLAEIQRLDAGSWKDDRFVGVKVPTLQETLAMMPENIWLNVHTRGGAEAGTAVAREIVRQGRLHQAFLATGWSESAAARKVHPNILICNMGHQGYDSRYVNESLERGDQFVQLLRDVASPEDMARLKAAGVRINYFGFDLRHPDRLKRYFDAGVDFPLVDDVEKMMPGAEALGIERWKPVYRKDNDKQHN
jgi:glycerophosphoryl diester phosphodiesterase